MGTTSQAITDRNDSRKYKKVLEDVKSDPTKDASLRKAIAAKVNEVIFRDPALRDIRGRIQNAIGDKVKDEIVKKYEKCVVEGKKPAEWPF